MPSRILLISANRCHTPDPVFPLGLAYLNGALNRAGHECRWLDWLIEPERLVETLRNWGPQYAGISVRNIDDVLIRKREVFFEEVAALITAIRRESRCKVILGGSGFSIFPEALLERTGADFGIVGEGETGLVALAAALETGSDYRSIPGLVFRQTGKIMVNDGEPGHEAPGLRLEDRPGPIASYYLETGGMLNVQTQRGCALRCCYCTYPLIEGRYHRRRSGESVAEEFAQLQQLGARYVFIVDSVFNSSTRHVAEICEALLRRNIRVPWGCFLRPQGLSADLMRLMARAGLTHIEFGSDSFCDEVLAGYQKGFSFQDILQSSELARAEKIDFCHFLIAGGPGETQATLERGFENSRRLKEAVILVVAGMRIYPGTDLFRKAVADGVISPDADLLRPTYYLAPGLTETGVFSTLRGFSAQSPNWIVGDPEASYQSLVARLRKRGVLGPLWSYFSMLQHLGSGPWMATRDRIAGP